MADRRRAPGAGGGSRRAHRVAGTLLVLSATVIGVGQWLLYDPTPISQGNRGRAVFVALVLAVSGWRLLVVPEAVHVVSLRAAMLAGGALVCFAVLSPHDRPYALLMEGLCGAGALVASMAALPSRRQSPSQSSRHSSRHSPRHSARH